MLRTEPRSSERAAGPPAIFLVLRIGFPQVCKTGFSSSVDLHCVFTKGVHHERAYYGGEEGKHWPGMWLSATEKLRPHTPYNCLCWYTPGGGGRKVILRHIVSWGPPWATWGTATSKKEGKHLHYLGSTLPSQHSTDIPRADLRTCVHCFSCSCVYLSGILGMLSFVSGFPFGSLLSHSLYTILRFIAVLAFICFVLDGHMVCLCFWLTNASLVTWHLRVYLIL